MNWSVLDRDYRGDGVRVERPVEGGEKALHRVLRRRMVVDGERTYSAYSADELIELDNLARHDRRPGLPY